MTRRARAKRDPRRERSRPPTVGPASTPGEPSVAADVWIPLLLITLAALAMRLWALRYQPTVTFDGTEYVRFADALAHGRGFASVFAPGYPLLAALAGVVVPDRVGAAVLVSLIAGTALPAIVWRLGRAALGPRGALIPALACALHPELARHSAITMSESAYLGALYLALALIPTRYAALGGLSLGFAYATRPEGLVAAVGLGIAGVRDAMRRRRAWTRVATTAAACALVVLACIAWYHATLGAWTLTPKTAALHASASDWRAAEPTLVPQADAAPPLVTRLLASLAAWPANAWRHAQALLWSWPWPLLLLSLVGLTRHRGIETAALLYLPLLPLLGLSQQGRFALAAIPALAISATVAILHERARWRRAVAIALAALGVAAAGWSLEEAFRTPFDGSALTDRRAGEWLASLAGPGDPVVDRKPFVAFYAGGRHRVLADGPYEALVDDMVAGGARWLVLQEYVVRQMRPQFAPLLDSQEFRDRESRLEMVYARADASHESLAIFRVLAPGQSKTGQPPHLDLEGFTGRPAAR